MKILLVGGHSSLAQMLQPVLASFAEVLTAGRNGCDVDLDLSWPAEKFILPEGIDVVINTAAHFGGCDFDENLSAVNVNAIGGLKLCNATLKAGAKHFVNISSTSAYLDSTSDYYGFYSLSKRYADEVIELFCIKENLLCTILRPSQLYGELDSFRKHQPFLYSTLDKALRNEDITIYGNRDALRNYIHVEDFCRVIASVISSGIVGTYSCTSLKDISLFNLANMIVKAARSESRVIFNEAKSDIQDNIFPYDDNLYQKISTYPTIEMVEGISRLVEGRLVRL